MPKSSSFVLGGRPAQYVRRTITTVVFVIAGLAFAFSFGNGLELGLALGVPYWIAMLVAPAVDLSVAALIISVQYLRSEGVSTRLIGARLLLALCGLATLVINTGRAVLTHQFGRAAFDAVAPGLLMFWGEVGPGLLMLLHSFVRDVPDGSGPSSELLAQARKLDHEHRAATGRRLSRDRMRAALGISNALASELVRTVRITEDGGDG